MITINSEVDDFLKRFHTSKDIDEVFTKGCCYWFAFVLSRRFPEGRIMYDQINNHFTTEINGSLYDITGDVTGKYSVEPWDELNDELLKNRLARDCIMF